MNKKELQEAYDLLLEKYDVLKQDYDLLTENFNDHKGVVEAYTMENAKMKKALAEAKTSLKDAKAKQAAQNNRANQISHRKRELEEELNVYRTTINAYGSKHDRLAHMIDLHFSAITERMIPVKWYYGRQLKAKLELLNNTVNAANIEIKSYF